MSRRRVSSQMLGLVALSSAATVAAAIVFRPRRDAAPPAPGATSGGHGLSAAAPMPPGSAPAETQAQPPGAAAAPAAPPAPINVQGTADFDRGIVAGLEQTLPGTLESYDFLRQWVLREPARVVATLERYKSSYASWLAAQQAAGAISQSNAHDAQAILKGFGTATTVKNAVTTGLEVAGKVLDSVGDSVAAVPAVGAAIKIGWQIVQKFVDAAAEAASQGHSLFGGSTITNTAPVFCGFRDGNFFFWDVPVWAFTAPMWVTEFNLAGGSSAWLPMLQGFKALALAQPFGYPVTPVTIENDGSFSYRFNLVAAGDLSDAAISRQEVRGVTVWSPLDITGTGPRGFDPQNPWSWKFPGQKKSRFDD